MHSRPACARQVGFTQQIYKEAEPMAAVNQKARQGEKERRERMAIGFSRMEKKYEWKDHVIFMGILLGLPSG